MRPRTAALVTLVFSLSQSHPAGPRPGDILGHWQGTSICVRADWNLACRDEVVSYEFVPAGTDSTHSLLHAAKLVGQEFQPMYDLEFAFSSDSGTWDGDFANSRVRIRWSYRLRNDTLFGVVLRLPGRVVGRRVVATRHPAP